ncbi:hypothetical protein D3C80_1578220 [compost metagenome]
MWDGTQQRQFRDVAGHFEQQRQEHHQRHDGVDQDNTQTLDNRGKAHCIFLHTLGSTLNVAQLFPLGQVEIIHRCTPAENIVASKKQRRDA